ncbi:MAG: hypothetical protein R3E88_21330 [Myxococcota bacterium]|nr:hypothetical protein [Myxococcales bacterium]
MRASARRVALGLMLALAAVGAAVPGVADGQADERPWELTKGPRLRRIATHGSKVWGHLFGFVARDGRCGDEILWITWSAKANLDDLRGERAQVRISSGAVEGIVTPAITATTRVGTTHVFVLTNFAASEALTSLLAANETADVAIVGPPELVERLEVRSDEFGLAAYAHARGVMLEDCEPGDGERGDDT